MIIMIIINPCDIVATRPSQSDLGRMLNLMSAWNKVCYG